MGNRVLAVSWPSCAPRACAERRAVTSGKMAEFKFTPQASVNETGSGPEYLTRSGGEKNAGEKAAF